MVKNIEMSSFTDEIRVADNLLFKDKNGKPEVRTIHRDRLLLDGYEMGWNPRKISEDIKDNVLKHKKSFVDKAIYVVEREDKEGYYTVVGGQHLVEAFKDKKQWKAYVFRAPKNDEEDAAISTWGLYDNDAATPNKYAVKVDFAGKQLQKLVRKYDRDTAIKIIARRMGGVTEETVKVYLDYYDQLSDKGLLEKAVAGHWSLSTVRKKLKEDVKDESEDRAIEQSVWNKIKKDGFDRVVVEPRSDGGVDYYFFNGVTVIKAEGELRGAAQEMLNRKMSGRQLTLSEFENGGDIPFWGQSLNPIKEMVKMKREMKELRKENLILKQNRSLMD